MKDIKKTYGQIVHERNQKILEVDDDVTEYRRSMEPDILNMLNETVNNTLKSPIYKNKDFYVVLITKKERLGDVPRNYVFSRISCPTPVYRQSVWKYMHNSGSLEFLWVIPDMDLYWHIIRNASAYRADKECSDLAKFVMLMESGELLEWVKRENGEKQDVVIKINNEVQ